MYVIAKLRLVKDTRKVTTKTGTPMRTGFGFADVDSESGLPVSLVAFNNLADALGKYHKGDTVRVAGTFKANDYVKQDGTEVKGWQIVLEGIAGVKHATMKRQKPKQASSEAYRASEQFQDDEIAF